MHNLHAHAKILSEGHHPDLSQEGHICWNLLRWWWHHHILLISFCMITMITLSLKGRWYSIPQQHNHILNITLVLTWWWPQFILMLRRRNMMVTSSWYSMRRIIIFLSYHIVKIIMILFVYPIFRKVLLPRNMTWSKYPDDHHHHISLRQDIFQNMIRFANMMMTSCSKFNKGPGYHDDVIPIW